LGIHDDPVVPEKPQRRQKVSFLPARSTVGGGDVD